MKQLSHTSTATHAVLAAALVLTSVGATADIVEIDFTDRVPDELRITPLGNGRFSFDGDNLVVDMFGGGDGVRIVPLLEFNPACVLFNELNLADLGDTWELGVFFGEDGPVQDSITIEWERSRDPDVYEVTINVNGNPEKVFSINKRDVAGIQVDWLGKRRAQIEFIRTDGVVETHNVTTNFDHDDRTILYEFEEPPGLFGESSSFAMGSMRLASVHVPAPGALALLGVAGLISTRRRR